MTRDGPSVITKRLHGSDTAATFWLKNSQPERWRDHVETDIRAVVVNIEATPEEKARIIAATLSRRANATDT